jgi:hypothetical protein
MKFEGLRLTRWLSKPSRGLEQPDRNHQLQIFPGMAGAAGAVDGHLGCKGQLPRGLMERFNSSLQQGRHQVTGFLAAVGSIPQSLSIIPPGHLLSGADRLIAPSWQ